VSSEIEKGKRLREEAAGQIAILREEISAAAARMDEISRQFQSHQETLSQQEKSMMSARHDLRLQEEKLKETQQEFNGLHPAIQDT
jgi:uncharacterized protein involved in exopolysaccharide biosynthesis